MNYISTIVSDIGIEKKINQDSYCLKIATTSVGEILLAIVCDGMGGLKKGEVASSTTINIFSKWFENDLPIIIEKFDFEVIKKSWSNLIILCNEKIIAYGKKNNIKLGTTLSALLIIEYKTYIFVHIGDSRIYRINDKLEILTKDHTLVQREVDIGNISVEQSEIDPRKNILLQCLGVSEFIEPQFCNGLVKENDLFIICSDGFRHKITKEEIKKELDIKNTISEKNFKNQILNLVELNKKRLEKDNITVIGVKIM